MVNLRGVITVNAQPGKHDYRNLAIRNQRVHVDKNANKMLSNAKVGGIPEFGLLPSSLGKMPVKTIKCETGDVENYAPYAAAAGIAAATFTLVTPAFSAPAQAVPATLPAAPIVSPGAGIWDWLGSPGIAAKGLLNSVSGKEPLLPNGFTYALALVAGAVGWKAGKWIFNFMQKGGIAPSDINRLADHAVNPRGLSGGMTWDNIAIAMAAANPTPNLAGIRQIAAAGNFIDVSDIYAGGPRYIPNSVTGTVNAKLAALAAKINGLIPAGNAQFAPNTGQLNAILMAYPRPPLTAPPVAFVNSINNEVARQINAHAARLAATPAPGPDTTHIRNLQSHLNSELPAIKKHLKGYFKKSAGTMINGSNIEGSVTNDGFNDVGRQKIAAVWDAMTAQQRGVFNNSIDSFKAAALGAGIVLNEPLRASHKWRLVPGAVSRFLGMKWPGRIFRGLVGYGLGSFLAMQVLNYGNQINNTIKYSWTALGEAQQKVRSNLWSIEAFAPDAAEITNTDVRLVFDSLGYRIDGKPSGHPHTSYFRTIEGEDNDMLKVGTKTITVNMETTVPSGDESYFIHLIAPTGYSSLGAYQNFGPLNPRKPTHRGTPSIGLHGGGVFAGRKLPQVSTGTFVDREVVASNTFKAGDPIKLVLKIDPLSRQYTASAYSFDEAAKAWKLAGTQSEKYAQDIKGWPIVAIRADWNARPETFGGAIPSTSPAPSTPAPATPEPGTPAPVTPAPATPKPADSSAVSIPVSIDEDGVYDGGSI